MCRGKENNGDLIKLLHFFPANEKKFEAQARTFFDRDFLDNSWIKWPEQGPNQVDSAEADRIAKTFDWVIFHSAPFKLIETIKTLSKKSRTIIQFWGGDYSTLLVPHSRLYLRRTRQEFWWKLKKGNVSVSFIRFRWFLAKGIFRRKRYLDGLSSCDHFCLLAGEAEMKWLPSHLRAKRAPWSVNYASGNEIDWSFSFEAEYEGANILLGNSATLANNHVDVIKVLSDTRNKSNQILIPLSYGNSEVQRRVEKIAIEEFGERARPLTNFVPQKHYFRLLDSVGFVIMGHMRQQALGILYWALYTRRTVYLWEESDLYEHFCEMDFVIRRIRSIENLGLVGLKEEEAEKNKILVGRLLLNDSGRELELFFKTPIE